MSYGMLHRWSKAARSVVMRDSRRPRRVFRLADVEPGWNVVDADELPVGTVQELESQWIAVNRGLLHRRLYVPLTAIGAVTEGLVRLNATIDGIDEERWTQKPHESR
jgi:hypothetical protein